MEYKNGFPLSAYTDTFRAFVEAGWRDSTYRNDACPSVTLGNLKVWCGSGNPEDEEGGEAVCLILTNSEGDYAHTIAWQWAHPADPVAWARDALRAFPAGESFVNYSMVEQARQTLGV